MDDNSDARSAQEIPPVVQQNFNSRPDMHEIFNRPFNAVNCTAGASFKRAPALLNPDGMRRLKRTPLF
jgi:hypothetical protein